MDHLTEELRRFVAELVASGRYPTEESVLADALDRMRGESQRGSLLGDLDAVPLWGLFRDEPELIDQIAAVALRSRRPRAPGAPADE